MNTFLVKPIIVQTFIKIGNNVKFIIPMAKLAIKGHATRGKEVIEILEMLGGINTYACKAVREKCFYFIVEGEIDYDVERYITDEYTIFTLEEFLEKYPYKVGDKVQHKGATSCGSIYEVEKMRWEADTVKYTLRLFGCNYKTSTLPAEYLQPYKEETMEEKGTLTQIDLTRELCIADEVEVILGDYEFRLKDGKTYFVRIKPPYPKTYKECCDVLGLSTMDNDAKGYKDILIVQFQELLIARDAYWKIAGKQMWLGKPWEPDWLNAEQDKFVLYTHDDGICLNRFVLGHNVLAFPTAELRDAFYENFKKLIESCKELL